MSHELEVIIYHCEFTVHAHINSNGYFRRMLRTLTFVDVSTPISYQYIVHLLLHRISLGQFS